MRRWLSRLAFWDGCVPAMVWWTPSLLALVFPNRFLDLTIVILPIAALFMRLRAGGRYIRTNSTSPESRELQAIALFLGCLAMVAIDAVMLVSHFAPNEKYSEIEKLLWLLLWLSYLTAMAIALFPWDVRNAWRQALQALLLGGALCWVVWFMIMVVTAARR